METIHATRTSVNDGAPNDANFRPEYGADNRPGQGNSGQSALKIDPTEIRDFLQALDADNEPPCDGLFASFDDDHGRAEAQDEYIWQPHVQAMKAELRKKEDELKADPKNAQLQAEVKGLRDGWAEIEQEMPGHFVQHKYGPVNMGMVTWMNARQKNGCGIFLTIQAMQTEDGKKPKRLKKNFAYGRAVFVEDDTPRKDGPRTDWPLPPSWINKSSETEKGAKYHYYWFIQFSTAFDRETIEAIQRRMAEPVEKGGYGSDTACIDAARVMRMPGTWNLKAGRPPFLVKALEKNGKRYTAEQILAAFPPIVIEKPKPRTDRFSAQGELSRFTEPGNPLDRISADEEYTWMQVGWALHHESGGSQDGLRIWEDWSSTSTKFKEGECARKWAGMKCGGGITGGVIYAFAKDAGWRREDLEEERERTKAREGKGKKAKNPHREKSSQKAKGEDHAKEKSPPPPPGDEPPAAGGADKPENYIQVNAGELHEATEAAMRMLVDSGVDIFQRGAKLVRPIRSPGVDSKGRIVETAILMEIDKVFMRKLLCQHITWEKFDGRTKKLKRIDAPEEIAKMILASAGQWPFRTISGIVSTPTIRFDGTVLHAQGYDQRTHLFLESAVVLPPIPENPTRAEAEEAMKLLDGLLVEFPFVDAASRSVALSAMLSSVARGMFDVVPAHGAKAPTPGTGKSYLFDIVAAIVLGERCPVISVSVDSEGETEKRIIGMAIAGRQIIHLDNVNGLLGGDALCQLIERPTCDLRVLGKSEPVRVENRSIIFFNGNNCRVQGDMTRRVLTASLDARMEKPAEREFASDPVATVLADRGKYIAACMTVLRAYIKAGKPKVCKVPMNSFGEWSATVRSAMVWLGYADPCDTIETAREGDPVLQQVAAFCVAAKPVLGSVPTSGKFVGDLVKAAEAGDNYSNGWVPRYPELASFMEDFKDRGQISKPRVGRWLEKYIGRVVDGLCIKNLYDRKAKANRWFIEMLSGPEPEPEAAF